MDSAHSEQDRIDYTAEAQFMMRVTMNGKSTVELPSVNVVEQVKLLKICEFQYYASLA